MSCWKKKWNLVYRGRGKLKIGSLEIRELCQTLLNAFEIWRGTIWFNKALRGKTGMNLKLYRNYTGDQREHRVSRCLKKFKLEWDSKIFEIEVNTVGWYLKWLKQILVFGRGWTNAYFQEEGKMLVLNQRQNKWANSSTRLEPHFSETQRGMLYGFC